MIWATKKVKKLSAASRLGRQKNQLNETFAASHVHLMDHSGESSLQIIDSYLNGEKIQMELSANIFWWLYYGSILLDHY